MLKTKSWVGMLLMPLSLVTTFGLQSCTTVKLVTKQNGVWGDDEYLHNDQNLTYQDEAETVHFLNDPRPTQASNIIYQILVYAFADGNNDGIGDFIGLRKKLPYLKKLGVDQLYLSPIHPASSYHGYDVIDYTKVAPELGGDAAFDAFLIQAHQLGFKVYLDFVFNHTSYEHPWFQKALQGVAPYVNYYHFQTDETTFGDLRQDDQFAQGFLNLPKHKPTYQRYIAKFYAGMPDLNLDNPQVIQELKNIQYFWTKKGVDGFRYDAISEYFSSQGETQNNYNVAKIIAQLRDASQQAITDAKRQINDVFMLGEWWGDPLSTAPYLHDHAKAALNSLYDGRWRNDGGANDSWATKINVAVIKNFLEKLHKFNPQYVWTPFLDNHDTERWINAYRFLRPAFNGSRLKERLPKKAIAALNVALFQMLARPATPIIYYGGELAYHGSKAKGDVGVREPMFWNNDPAANVQFYERRSGAQNTMIARTYSQDRPSADLIAQIPNQPYQVIAASAQIRRLYPFMTKSSAATITNAAAILTNPDLYTFVRTNGTTKLLFIYSLGAPKKYYFQAGYGSAKRLLAHAATIDQDEITLAPQGYIALQLR